MNLTALIKRKAKLREAALAAAERKAAAETAAPQSIDHTGQCPECSKPMDKQMAGSKPAWACLKCRICLPRHADAESDDQQ